MKVLPQNGGALLIQEPAPETVYDMGNARLYARSDAQGRIVSATLAKGAPLAMMEAVRYAVMDTSLVSNAATIDETAQRLAAQFKGTRSEGTGKTTKRMWQVDDSQILRFDGAQAVGRIWILTGQHLGLSVTLTTFMNEASPALFQRVQVTNTGIEARLLTLDIVTSLQFKRNYVSAGTTANGHIHAHMQVETNFGATIPPWQVNMDKLQTTVQYALPVEPGESAEFCIVTAAGSNAVFEEFLRTWREALAEAEQYTRRLSAFASDKDPLLQSLIVAGLNTGLSAYKKLDSGVGGFLAGIDYAYPPRAYFRDSYWTAQAALIAQPPMVRDNLLWLARGIRVDGSCPSGVWDPGLFTAAELETPGVCSWLPDHYDSPSFFVLLLHDYVASTGDMAVLAAEVNGLTLWQHAAACLKYLTESDQDGDGLFEKPHAANDWADNVHRDSLVTYDLALFYGALECMARLAKKRGEVEQAKSYKTQAERVKAAMNASLWDETLGYYRNYQREGFSETNLSIDTLLTLLYGIADEDQTIQVLDAAKHLLQTRNNQEQVYGDWGVMCCYPFYHELADLFSISAEPYHYHNGGDWPYWDGVYGAILLQRDDPDARYVLSRWWEIALENGWLTPFEYAAPPYPQGSLLQGWSTMPAVALLSGQLAPWLLWIR